MTLTWVDTHVHLDDPAFDADRLETIADARAAGVGSMVNIGYCPARWDSTIALAASDPDITLTLGLHPGHAHEGDPEILAALAALIARHHPAAIGEMGLDYSRPEPDRAIQRVVFRYQLDLAATRGLPVVIHQRESADDCAAILAETAPERDVILHSFDGSESLLRLGLERGWTFGIGGLVTRRGSVALREALPTIPPDQIVLETDSPYLMPAGSTGRRNDPTSIPRIAETVAGLTGRSEAEIRVGTSATARRVFGLRGNR